MEKWEELVEAIELPDPDQKVYIWGAGNTSTLNHQGMLRENLYKELGVKAFLDSNKAGTSFNGFNVYSPSVLDYESLDEVFIIISTTDKRVFQEIRRICKEKRISNCLLDAAILKARKGNYKYSVNLFSSKESKVIFNRLLENRISLCDDYDDLYAGESYFGIRQFCIPDIKDVIIDCGAYVGDSAERFIWRMDKFMKYIAIEPDYENFQALQKRFSRLREEWNLPKEKIIALHGGVDSATKFLSVESRVGGLASLANDTKEATGKTDAVQFWALDDLFPEGFSYLKADVESYEYRMLCGARESIKKYHPRMAICIYHSIVDMYSIPRLIHELDPSYRLEIRHHSYDFAETVLYAY